MAIELLFVDRSMIMKKYFKVEIHPEIEDVSDIPQSSKGCPFLYMKKGKYFACVVDDGCPFRNDDRIRYCRQIYNYEEVPVL